MRPTWLYLGGVVGVLAVTGGVFLVAHTRTASAEAEGTRRSNEEALGPPVRIATATRSPSVRRIDLQGEARAFASVTLYAKLSGYLKSIRVDKGDHVREGQIIGVIESPEVDRQYDAAVADAHVKRANAKRAEALSAPGVVSKSEADIQKGAAEVADAQVSSLATQKSYETLRAPFSGTVTARFADPGALVQNATNAQTSALPLVTVSQVERLRVYVYVDQRDASEVSVGDAAEVRLPGRAVTRKGRVTRRSDELDLRTRTMLVEVDLDNRDGAIVPGSFVDVSLTLKATPLVQVPVEALIMRGKDAFTPVVESEHVHIRPLVIADLDGKTARLSSGLREGEVVALNLGQNVPDGSRVRPTQATQPGANGPGK